jgi:hypothetical protein
VLEESCTVIPTGNAPAASVTFEANPLPGVIVIAVVPNAPGATVMLDGAALSANDDGADTDTVSVVVLVNPPLVPVTRIEYVPAVAELLAPIVSALVPAPGDGIVEGANATGTPAGIPDAVKTTAPLNPFATALVSITGELVPC